MIYKYRLGDSTNYAVTTLQEVADKEPSPFQQKLWTMSPWLSKSGNI